MSFVRHAAGERHDAAAAFFTMRVSPLLTLSVSACCWLMMPSSPPPLRFLSFSDTPSSAPTDTDAFCLRHSLSRSPLMPYGYAITIYDAVSMATRALICYAMACCQLLLTAFQRWPSSPCRLFRQRCYAMAIYLRYMLLTIASASLPRVYGVCAQEARAASAKKE